MVENEMQQTLYQYHTGNALSILANAVVALGGKEIDYPMYTELIGKSKKQKDERSAAEIKADILAKFTAG